MDFDRSGGVIIASKSNGKCQAGNPATTVRWVSRGKSDIQVKVVAHTMASLKRGLGEGAEPSGMLTASGDGRRRFDEGYLGVEREHSAVRFI